MNVRRSKDHSAPGAASGAEAGLSLLELMVAVGILALVSLVMLRNVSTSYDAAQTHRDKVFAFTTATSILAELHAMVEGAAEEEGVDLDAFDDGAGASPVLSVALEAGVLVAPDHPNSRNIMREDRWIWARRVQVRPLPGVDNRNLRYVTVTVLKRDGMAVLRPMASLSTVLNTRATGFPTTQVFDVYLLAIENIPGWWVNMEAMRSFVEATLADLEARNPGLEFRPHWITKSSYGRNEVYRPYVNVDVASNDPIPSVYFYPGLLSEGPTSNYYSRDIIKARVATDAGEFHGYDATKNPHPYALADFYNHAMRLPREEALHEQRVGLVRARRAAIEQAERDGTAVPAPLDDMSEEPTLRLFLEDLNRNPDRYRHALIVNLHGELLPLPPLRNYSDAARLPRVPELAGVRVVTHPEQLRTMRDPSGAGEDVVLRVYAYTTDPTRHTGPDRMPVEHPIAIQVVDMDLVEPDGSLAPGVTVESLPGGVPVGGASDYRPFAGAKRFDDPSLQPGEMFYEASYFDGGAPGQRYTLIRLFNTPVQTPPVEDSTAPGMFRGLFSNERSLLYGLEYVPSCTEAAKDFSRDLFTAGDGPKNTARWRIRIPHTAFADSLFVDADGGRTNPRSDVVLAVRTRIHDDLPSGWESSGQLFPTAIDPENLSETYTWWADSASDVPFTERAQFLGDPRHNPYRDLLEGDPDFPGAYNPYHDSLAQNGENAAADFPGLSATRLRSRWMDKVRADVPRFCELYRRGLARSSTVYSSITGWSYYYMAFGNEIGADSANGYPDSIPVHLAPYGNESSTGYVNNITPNEVGGAATGGRRLVRSSEAGGDHWWGMPWLGELYPDSVYSTQWLGRDTEGNVRGNLTAGRGSGKFFRDLESSAHVGSRFEAFGTVLERSEQRSYQSGCTSFFNIGTPSQTFHHRGRDGTQGTLVDAGPELAANYNLELPTQTSVSRPFSLTTDGTGAVPPEFSLQPYSSERYSASILRTYYDHADSGWRGSALVQLRDPADATSAFVNISGIDRTLEIGTAQIAKFAILSLVHSYMEAGEPTVTHHISRTPRVEIIAPTEITELERPADTEVQWELSWRRWDGQGYTENTDPGFFEDESSVEYALLYSDDNGSTWQYLQDEHPATPGERPARAANLVADVTSGNERYTWALPADRFPQGSYLLRIEAYPFGNPLHYAYHQVRIFIER